MPDFSGLFDLHVNYRCAIEGAGVRGLAPAFRIEGRGIEQYRRPAPQVGALHDPRRKARAVGIFVVETPGFHAMAKIASTLLLCPFRREDCAASCPATAAGRPGRGCSCGYSTTGNGCEYPQLHP